MQQGKRICAELRMTHNMMFTSLNRRLQQYPDMDGVTLLHGRIIRFLCDNAGRDVYQRDIEELLAVRRSTVTAILKSMEKNRLIKRESAEHDARLKRIRPTERALSIHDCVTSELDSLDALTRKGISDEEIECFLRVLGRMRKNFTETDGRKP